MTDYLSDHDWEMVTAQSAGMDSHYIPYQITHGAMKGLWIVAVPEFEEERSFPFFSRSDCEAEAAKLEQWRAERAADPDGWEGGFAENH